MARAKQSKAKAKAKAKRPYRKRYKARIYRDPIPASQIVKHGYNTSMTVTSTTGVVGYQIFRLNSLFDPDYSNGGTNHQPYGFDSLSALYNKFVVLSSKIRIRFSASSNVMLVCKSTTDVSTPTNLELQAEQNNSDIKYGSNITTSNLGMYAVVANVFGVKKEHIREDEYFSGSPSANPSRVCYWMLSIQHPDRVSTVNVYMNVQIEYYAKWYDRVTLTTS